MPPNAAAAAAADDDDDDDDDWSMFIFELGSLSAHAPLNSRNRFRVYFGVCCHTCKGAA